MTETSRKSRRSAVPERRRFTRENLQFIGVFMILVLTGVVENVTYSINGKLYMRQYRCMLNILVVMACTLFFFVIVNWQRFKKRLLKQKRQREAEMRKELEGTLRVG